MIEAMRPLLALTVAFAFLIGAGEQSRSNGAVRAWSSTNGPYGQVWHLVIQSNDAATVTSSSELGAKSLARHFKISMAQREAIVRAAEESQFFALPESVGPSSVPIHGPDNTLELELHGRVHKVFLNDPASATGPQVDRFRRVWRTVVDASPIKPPL